MTTRDRWAAEDDLNRVTWEGYSNELLEHLLSPDSDAGNFIRSEYDRTRSDSDADQFNAYLERLGVSRDRQATAANSAARKAEYLAEGFDYDDR